MQSDIVVVMVGGTWDAYFFGRVPIVGRRTGHAVQFAVEVRMLGRTDAGGTFGVKGLTGLAGHTFSVEGIPGRIGSANHTSIVESKERQGFRANASLFVEIENEVVRACHASLQLAVPKLRSWAG